MEKLSGILESSPRVLSVAVLQEALRSVSFSTHQPMKMFALAAPAAVTVAELHPADGAVSQLFSLNISTLNLGSLILHSCVQMEHIPVQDSL